MARPPRIEFENAWYHVMNRGAGRRSIFADDSARRRFLVLLSEVSSEFKIQIHAYCLMGNHFHLLIRTPYANLNLAMQKLSSVYTRDHNKTHRTDGPLFKGRYKAILIAEDSYLAHVGRYIHRNPVEAKLVVHPKDYLWSSYQAYYSPKRDEPWLCLDELVNQVSQTRNHDHYLKFVENPLVPSMGDFYRSNRLPGVLGNKEARRLVENHTGFHRNWKPLDRLQVSEISAAVAQVFAVPQETIFQSKRGNLNIARAVTMYLAQNIAGYPASEIAVYFHVGSSSVTHMIRRLKGISEKELKILEMIECVKQVLISV